MQVTGFKDGDVDFGLFPSLENLRFSVYNLGISTEEHMKLPPMAEGKEAEEHIHESMDEALKVQVKSACLLRAKTISEEFARPGRKYRLEHDFGVAEDALSSGGFRRRLVSQKFRQSSRLTDMVYSRWYTTWTP